MDLGIYHVFNKSIAGYKIFNMRSDYLRMRDLCRYYQRCSPPVKFSRYKKYLSLHRLQQREVFPPHFSSGENIVRIVAYCFMPTHIHFILQPMIENGISIFVAKILNSYTRYFNLKHKRKGPLWEGRTKKILVKTQEQLVHLTRYIHLNPVTGYLVERPQDWEFSSYLEYLNLIPNEECICTFGDLLEINPQTYREFVEDRISYQRELAKIKALLIE